jgi:hypothetical protein
MADQEVQALVVDNGSGMVKVRLGWFEPGTFSVSGGLFVLFSG